MVTLVHDNLAAIRALCRRYRVHQLYLIGSGTDDTFDCMRSDVDFLVVFEPRTNAEPEGTYFPLLGELERLLDRGVHLIERHCVENPYVRASIERSKVPLYAAA